MSANGSAVSGGAAGSFARKRPALNLREHRKLAQPLEIDATHSTAAAPSSRKVTCAGFSIAGHCRVLTISSFVSHARRACATPRST